MSLILFNFQSRNKRKTTVEEEPSRDEGATLGDDGGHTDDGTALEPGKGKKVTAAEAAFVKFAQSILPKSKFFFPQLQLNLPLLEIDGLKAEFASLTSFTPADVAATAFAQHKDKNRYHNILCYDHSRVVLKYNVPPDTDYIHVSFVCQLFNINQTIRIFRPTGYLTQITSNLGISSSVRKLQPMPQQTTFGVWYVPIFTYTVFTRSVFQLWQEKPKHIIMLCRTVENGSKFIKSLYFIKSCHFQNPSVLNTGL